MCFIKLYYIIIPATCFGSNYRAIFRLIIRQVECKMYVLYYIIAYIQHNWDFSIEKKMNL